MNGSHIQEGAFVSYGSSGVCRVGGMRRMRLSESLPEKLYYELHPAREAGQAVFVPADCERLCAKIRRVMTKDEVDALLDRVAAEKPEWIDDKHAREEHFRKTLADGVSGELVRIVCSLYLKKRELAARRRRLSSGDERTMKAAERLIEDELAFALGIEPGDVTGYIRARIGTEE